MTIPIPVQPPTLELTMRAKMRVTSVRADDGAEHLTLQCVTTDNADDNSFAQAVPNGGMYITITNPALLKQFEAGVSFFVDFTLDAETVSAPVAITQAANLPSA